MVFTLLLAIVPLANAFAEEHAKLNSSDSLRLILYGVMAVLILVAVIIVMLFIRLKTKIANNSIYVAYLPFIRKWKKITAQEVDKYEVRKYRAMLEYGGYGMKRRRKVGQAFTISGNIGLQLYLKNGKKILIGTQKKQAIEYAMVKLMGAGNKFVTGENSSQETESIVRRKVKKILIIIAIEIVAAILIFGIIQLLN